MVNKPMSTNFENRYHVSLSRFALTMDELNDFSSSIVEFKSSHTSNKLSKLVDNCIGTDSMPASQDAAVQTNRMAHLSTQTQNFNEVAATVDESRLAFWLRTIYPKVELELLRGPTPMMENFSSNQPSTFGKEFLIQTYQKICLSTPSSDNAQGLATWLAVHTNNAPVLAVTTVGHHDDWCEHLNQSLKLFVPKRVPNGNFVVFTELKNIPLKSCLKSLCTNTYNKNTFAGSTLAGDIYIWRYTINGTAASSIELHDVFCENSQHGAAVAMDWATESRLLTCHANGWVVVWIIGNSMLMEKSFFIEPPKSASNELTALLSINATDFIVGTNDGGIYHCSTSHMAPIKTTYLELTPLKRHLFMITTLLKRTIDGHTIVISADLSGQVNYHDIRNSDEDTANVIVQIPLPFKNAIACAQDGNMIYCPGDDGVLECYSVQSGQHNVISGDLQGKGNLIKCSENGLWIITGLYGSEFQIFYVDCG